MMTLPDDARLWLFAFDGDPATLLPDVQAFCAGWTSHGRPVRAEAEVLAGRVLAVAALIAEADVNAGVSGCGIDAMQHAVEGAAAEHRIALTPALAVTLRDTSGAWTSMPRSGVRALVATGEVGPDARVLDLTPCTLGALRAAGGAERAAGDAWHAAAFGLGAGASA